VLSGRQLGDIRCNPPGPGRMCAGRGTKVQQAAQTLRLPFGTNHSEEGLAGSVLPRVLARIDGADPALDRICLLAPVDAHLDQLFLFSWIRAKSGGHTTGAGAHGARVHLAVEAICCPYRGRVRTFIFPFIGAPHSHRGVLLVLHWSQSQWIFAQAQL
jgi:hypothetical protein